MGQGRMLQRRPIGMSCAAGAMMVRQRRVQERQKGVLAAVSPGRGGGR